MVTIRKEDKKRLLLLGGEKGRKEEMKGR